MRGVKKNTKKIIAGFFVLTLILQGVFTATGSVLADEVDDGLYTNGIVGNDPINDTVQSNTQAAGAAVTQPTADQRETGSGLCSGVNIFCYLKMAVVWILLQVRNLIYIGIASPAAAGFAWVVDPANISGPTGILNIPAVYSLWQFIRDFFNLFFILILLFSAFATIFQVDSFNIRNIYKSVLLVALLINFSFPITRLLIDVANVPMYYFINDVIGNGTGKGGMIAMNNLLGKAGIAAGTQTVEGENNNIVPILMSIIFAFLFAISLVVLSVMLIVRLIALTLLLIFSPIGFASSLLPGLGSYGREWWSSFWKYAFFGPVAALMLVVSLKFLEASGGAFASMREASTNVSVNESGATSIAQMIFFTFPIILIWATIGIANKFSIAGAATVTGMGYSVANWTRKKIQGAALGTAKLAGRKVEKQLVKNKYTRMFSPTAVTAAWKARSEEQKHKDEAPVKQAAAAMQDTINRRMSKVIRNPLKWGSDKSVDHTENTFAESQRQAHEQEKHITEVNDSGDHVINESMHALNNKQLDTFNGALLALAKNNDLNDWVMRVGQEDQYKNLKDEKGNSVIDQLYERDDDGNVLKDAKGKVVVSSKNARILLAQTLRDAGEKDEELLAKRVMAISDRATASGNFAFGGLTKYDEKLNGGHGGFRLAEVREREVDDLDDKGRVQYDSEGKRKTKKIVVDEQAEWAAGKFRNLESQKRQTMLHPDSVFTRTSDGFGDINGEVAKAIFKTFTYADATQVERSRDDLKEAVYQGFQKGLPEFMTLYNDKNNVNFRSYVDAVRNLKEGRKKEADIPSGAASDQSTRSVKSSPKPTKEDVAKQAAKEFQDLEDKKNATTP